MQSKMTYTQIMWCCALWCMCVFFQSQIGMWHAVSSSMCWSYVLHLLLHWNSNTQKHTETHRYRKTCTNDQHRHCAWLGEKWNKKGVIFRREPRDLNVMSFKISVPCAGYLFVLTSLLHRPDWPSWPEWNSDLSVSTLHTKLFFTRLGHIYAMRVA